MLTPEELYILGFKIDWEKIARNSYLRYIPALDDLTEMNFDNPVTFFVGENGSGKSTLLEAVAVAYGFNPEGGTRNYNFSTYNSHSELFGAVTLYKSYLRPKWGFFLRAESFYNVASIEEEYRAHRSEHYHNKSHGESFLAVLQNNLEKDGLYILDEPEVALSPQWQLTLLLEIARGIKNNSQFIIATHSPILLGLPGAVILSFENGEIKPITYEETESYRVTKMFLDDRERLLNSLLAEL